jgi:GT2 family glycosyltransferase
MPANIDVIIVTYNSAATVAAAIASVASSSLVSRIVVVDNASADGSAAAARAAGADVVEESSTNSGFARAVNRGLMLCEADYVLLLNPDATIDASSLDLLSAELDAHTDVAMAGPALVAPSGETLLGARRFSTVANRTLWHLPLPWRPQWSTPEYRHATELLDQGAPVPVDYLWGAALLGRRSFLGAIGGLDERFFMYSEDEDLGREARARGLRVLLAPRARATHIGGHSTPDAALAQARIIAANAQLLAKWSGARAASCYRLIIGPMLAARALALTIAGREAEARAARQTLRTLHSHALDPKAAGDAPDRVQMPPASSTGQRFTTATQGRLLRTKSEASLALGYLVGTCRVTARLVRILAGLGGTRRAESHPAPTPSLLMTPQHIVRQDQSQASSAPPRENPPSASRTKQSPLISVILPVYNSERTDPRYLDAALESVASQTFRDFELIVVDDGSTDGTRGRVEDFLASRPELRPRVLRKANGGQSSARNHGARYARGVWLAFLDQDDEWFPNRLATVAGELHGSFDLVYTDADTINEDGCVVGAGVHRNLGRGGGHPKRELSDTIFQDVFVMPGVVTIRKELFERIEGFDEDLSGYEDDDLFLRAHEVGRLLYLPVSTLRWRIHGDSCSHSDKMIASGLRYREKLIAKYAQGDSKAETSRRITLRFTRAFLSHASVELVAGNDLYRENLAAAESLLSSLGAVDRAAYACTSWAWHTQGFAARCARSWFLNGLQLPTG